MSQSTADAWLTVSQAAARLKVSERTVRRRCENRKLRARLDTTATGKTWQIEAADIAAANGADGADIAAATSHEAGTDVRPVGAANVRPAAAIGAASEEVRALERQTDRMQGYLAAQMEASIARAVSEAIAPLVEQNTTLQAELRQLREIIMQGGQGGQGATQDAPSTANEQEAQPAKSEPVRATQGQKERRRDVVGLRGLLLRWLKAGE